MKVSIGRAAKALGVSVETLRRWEKQGRIKPERTPSGHRRYDLATLYEMFGGGRRPPPEEENHAEGGEGREGGT